MLFIYRHVLKGLVCKTTYSRGHRTDDSFVPVEPMSRFGLSLGSLGLCILWPCRSQGKPGPSLF